MCSLRGLRRHHPHQPSRHAMRDIHRDAYGDIPHPERECELDDLITDYEDYDDYSGSPAEIVARICDHADIVLTPDDSEPDPDPDRQRAQAVAVADGFLRAIDPGYAARHGAPKRGPPDG